MPDPIQTTKPAEFALPMDNVKLTNAANVDATIKALAESQPAAPQRALESVESQAPAKSTAGVESRAGVSPAPETGTEFESSEEAGLPIKKEEGFICILY